MKQLLSFGLVCFFSSIAPAQPAIQLDTLAVDFRVMKSDGSPPGPDVQAQLFLVKQNDILEPLQPATTFFGPPMPAGAHYYLNPVRVPIPRGQYSTLVMVRLRIWRGPEFSSSDIFGETENMSILLLNPSGPDANLDPLAGKTMVLVPEPTTITILIAGGIFLTMSLALKSFRRNNAS